MQLLAARWQTEHPCVSTLPVDAVLDDANLITLESVADLQHLEPFGTGNPQPTFVLTGASINSITPVGKGRHTRLKVTRDGCSFDAILFSYAPEATGLQVGARADLAFYPQINVFRGTRSIQLMLLDVKAAPSLAQLDRMLYERWKQGESFRTKELQMLIPERQDFVAVWRYLSAHAASNLFRESPMKLARNISRAAGLRETYARTMICLEVLQERGLIHFDTQPNAVQIRIQPVQGKVDLEASEILRSLRAMLD